MAVNIRFDDDVAILSNFGRLMDDPRHFETSRDVGELLDQGRRKFVIELRGVGALGASGIGLLLTITRLIRRRGGEAVLASPSRSMERLIDEMLMDSYWQVFEDVDQARAALDRSATRWEAARSEDSDES
jgi:anti-sigma B factor antagonist